MKQQAVSGGHELTIKTANEVLKAGGNAYDAAIAAYLMTFISEPAMASIAAGGFATVLTSERKSMFFDFFCQTPKRKHNERVDFYPITVDFGEATEQFHVGIASAAVPGAIAFIFRIHEMLGSMPLKELAAPTIKFAKEGLALNEFQNYDLGLLAEIFKADPRSREIFFNGDKVKDVGEKTYSPNLADFLETLVLEGEDLFYKGEVAKSIVKDVETRGGFLARDDFESYKVNIGSPLIYQYANRNIYTANQPSIGGTILVAYLHQLRTLTGATALSKEHFASVVKAACFVDSIKNDPVKLKNHISRLLSYNYHQLPYGNSKIGGTSHFNILDKHGNAISLTTSIGEGSGYVIPGTDMMMNNMLGESALLPNGLHSWIPDTRLNSMMTPTIVANSNGSVEYILGSGGASRIPFMIGQVLVNLLVLNSKDLKTAIELPRIHAEHGMINFEKGYHSDRSLASKDWQIKEWEKSLFFGGVHAIYHSDRDIQAYGDPRRHGRHLIE